MNVLAYAGCIHRFEINENGYVQIDIFGYDNNTENFVNILEKPLIPSMTMKSTQLTIAGSCIIDKGLLVLLHLISSNSSILMLLHLQSRPWLCNIIYTLSIPNSIHGSLKFLGINSVLTLFRNEDKNFNGFYIIDNNKQIYQRNIEFIQCSLLTYIYSYLRDNYYWIMGYDIDLNTKQKSIKIYYGCSTSLSTPPISFNTNKFIPITLIDNIQAIYVINHKIQLKSRLILGDVIISSDDHRILTCHNGTISHEFSIDKLITSILSYSTIENEELFLFIKKDNELISIFQSDENSTLIPYINSDEIANYVLIDDFIQTGWKQILFIKNQLDFNSFLLTDFSQIHYFQHDLEYEYNIQDKVLSMETEDIDIQNSLAIAQDILRKKIINADFIINEGYFHCKQIENGIQKLMNKYQISNLNINIQSENLLQLINLNWFIYRTNLYIYATLKNLSNLTLTSVYLFGIDKHSNKMKYFQLKTCEQCLLNDRMNLNLKSNSSLTFILTTLIELDKDIDIELYVLINDKQVIYHIHSLIISIDDLINPNEDRILKLNLLENQSINSLISEQAFIYLNTLFRLDVKIEITSKLHFIQYFKTLLENLGFKSTGNFFNIYLRVNPGYIFEHVLIHIVNQDDFIEDDVILHFYAENSNEATMIVKYILSKLDFQTFSLMNSKFSSANDEENEKILNRIQIELTSYIDILKSVPTIMRKINPTSKSEAYRLLKLENFQSFQSESQLTDLLLALFIID